MDSQIGFCVFLCLMKCIHGLHVRLPLSQRFCLLSVICTLHLVAKMVRKYVKPPGTPAGYIPFVDIQSKWIVWRDPKEGRMDTNLSLNLNLACYGLNPCNAKNHPMNGWSLNGPFATRDGNGGRSCVRTFNKKSQICWQDPIIFLNVYRIFLCF